MRYIYIDEAGTSQHEPVSIVAGVIVEADKQYIAVERRLKELLDRSVPPQLREGFIFHATSVWSDKSYRAVWSMEDRLSLLKSVMALPHEMGVAICMGMVRRDSDVPAGVQVREKFQHAMAFLFCIGRADLYVREYCGESEVATVIAEDVDGVKQHFRSILKAMRTPEFSERISGREMRLSAEERLRGVRLQDNAHKIERVRDTIHFVAKEDGLLLQLADACAFGFRRYFAKGSHGEEFVRAILGGTELVPEDWEGPASGGVFHDHPKRANAMRARFLPVWRA